MATIVIDGNAKQVAAFASADSPPVPVNVTALVGLPVQISGGSPAAGSGARQPFTVTVPVTTSGAYAAGDVVGGILSLLTVNYSTGRRVTLRSVQVNDKGNNSLGLHIYFFKSIPTAGTYTDNAALVWGTGDSALKVGQLNILAGDWITDGADASVNLSGIDLPMNVAATTLFMLIVCPTGSAPTLTDGDLTLVLQFDQE